MIDYLIDIDTEIFLFINGINSEFFDPIMIIISSKLIWVPMYLAIAAWIIKKYGWRNGLILIASIVVAVGISDIVCSQLIRPLVERLRPSNIDNPISILVHIVDGYRGGPYGFPSCHATNTFAFAISSGLILKNRTYFILILLWACLQCYSRLYLGVHYPADLSVGALIGSSFGFLAYYVVRKYKVLAVPPRHKA